jgi:hypothetical protein
MVARCFEIAMLEGRGDAINSLTAYSAVFRLARHVDTAAATSAAISRGLVVEISKYEITSKASASGAVSRPRRSPSRVAPV